MRIEEFLQISEILPEPMLLLELDGRILAANELVEDKIGLSRKDILGQRLDKLAHNVGLHHYIRACSRTRKLIPGSIVFKIKNQLTKWRVEGGVIIDPDTNLRKTILLRFKTAQSAAQQFIALRNKIDELSNQIHLRRELEVSLLKAGHEKDLIIYKLAHKLRPPLAPLRSGIDFFKIGNFDQNTAGPVIESMDRQLIQMVRLVDDLFDASLISRKSLILQVEKLELLPIIQASIETSRPLIEKHQNSLFVDVTKKPVFIEGDKARLVKAVSYILNNAAKSTQANGTIALVAYKIGDMVEISIQDNGIGIPEIMQSKVFDMFSQTQELFQQSDRGLGLGLYIVKGLITLHGGTVDMKSEGTGKGSKFTIRLPIIS